MPLSMHVSKVLNFPCTTSQEASVITLSFQCVELLCSDYLYMLPKPHIPKALGVLALYAKQVHPCSTCSLQQPPACSPSQGSARAGAAGRDEADCKQLPCPSPPLQDVILNVALTAVTKLWNVADTLARAAAATSETPGEGPGLGGARLGGPGGAGPASVPTRAWRQAH
jgi:hypothetical protein